jgi:hypothetical protein
MNRSRLLAPLVAVLLMVPAATAFAEDQEVKVRAMPADTLAITVDQSIDFGMLEVGETGHVDIEMTILNTTAGGWEVTVSGGDLTSAGSAYSIDKANLVVTGGDTDRWGDPSAVQAFTGSPGDAEHPLTVVLGTATAYGELSLDSPKTRLELAIPGETEPLLEYRTVLVYTITAAAPDS